MTLTAPLLCTLLVGAASGADQPTRRDGGAPKGRLMQVKLVGSEFEWAYHVEETRYVQESHQEVDPKNGRVTEVTRLVPVTVGYFRRGTCPAAGTVAYDRGGTPVRLEDLPALLKDGREALVIPGAGIDASAYRGLKTGRVLLILPVSELK